MKVSQLRQLIKEEIQTILKEYTGNEPGIKFNLDILGRPKVEMNDKTYFLYNPEDIKPFFEDCKKLGITPPEDILCVIYYRNTFNLKDMIEYGFVKSKLLQMVVGYGKPNDLKYLAKHTTIDPEVEQKFLNPKDPRWWYSSQKRDEANKLKQEIIQRNK